jgi:hypothetical protein
VYIRLHAEALHALERYNEAAERWELATLRPLSARTPDMRLASMIRLRLAASRLAAEQTAGGRAALALALSQGATSDPADPRISDRVTSVEAALRAGAWRIDDQVRTALGPSAFLADSLDQPSPFTGSASSRRPNLPPAPRPPPPEPPE